MQLHHGDTRALTPVQPVKKKRRPLEGRPSVGSSVCCAVKRGATLSKTPVSGPELQENITHTDKEPVWALAWSSRTSAPATGSNPREPKTHIGTQGERDAPLICSEGDRRTMFWRPLDAP
jgi:hypothetical protein